MLIEKGRIKPDLAQNMQNWKHTGFSVHRDVEIGARDEEGLARLTHYIARCPVAEAKIHQEDPEDDVLYDAEYSNPLPFQKWRALPQEMILSGARQRGAHV